MKKIKIVNCAEKIDTEDWNFLEDEMENLDIDWDFFINSPMNWLERKVTKPKISRYRACLQTVINARRKKANLMISHLPRATCWTSIFANFLSVKIPHMAFSFNFTDLPTGKSQMLMSYAFQSVDRFVVYSSAEKRLYSEYFAIDPSRFDVLPWAMEQPEFFPAQPILQGEYICSVGSEGRDYETLALAARQLPDIPLVVVARSESVTGINFPDHVKILTDVPAKEFWNVVRFSRLSVLPLRDRETNCGHISIVGAMMFGKPVVTTYSHGTTDYIVSDINALVSEPRDVDGLVKNISQLWNGTDLHSKFSNNTQRIALEHHQLDNWVRYLKQYFQDSGILQNV